MEWTLIDEDVRSLELDYRLKRAITFDLTVGSRSNIYKGFKRLFSLGTLWNGCSMMRTSGRQPWVSAQKCHNVWFDRWISLNFLQGFAEAIFIGVAMEWLLGDEDVWLVELEYRIKRAITFTSTVGSRWKFYNGFQRLFSLGLLWNRYSVMRTCGLQDLSISSKGAFNPTVGSRSKFYRGFQRLFFLG
jgi:hypothetical protein